jgi:hypothetical protein
MGWERRGKGGRQYYYLARREGRRVVKTYVGAGWAGLWAQSQAEQARAVRDGPRDRLRAERARHAAADRLAAALDTACRRLMTAALAAERYHKHGGEWRRWRHGPP